MISFFSFGDAYKVLSMSNQDKDHYNDKDNAPWTFSTLLGGAYYTYIIGLGEFDDFQWGNVAQLYIKCLFVVNTLFIQIILFNMFIAIISESFDHVNQQKK